jgi:hypothetical protein
MFAEPDYFDKHPEKLLRAGSVGDQGEEMGAGVQEQDHYNAKVRL